MKTIGIYLNAKKHDGGSYQYHLSIIKALEALAPSQYRIIAFSPDPEWRHVLPDRFVWVHARRTQLHRLLGRLYRLFDRSDENFIHFAGWFNPVFSKINQSDCDLVIFPSQDPACYQTKKRALAVVHDLMHRYESHFEEYKHGVYKLREKHFVNVCKYAKGILVDSAIGKAQVVESYGKNPGEIYVLPFVPPYYLLEAKDIDVKEKYSLPDRFIFYPAQFWEHKNHLRLLEAIRILKLRDVQVNLVLVGSRKNNYRMAMGKITEWDLGKQVFVLGYVANDEMYSLYKNAVALVFVSLIGPTNIPPVEAMLVGCPAVVSSAYAMPEQVGDAALLVNPKDANDIAQKIEMVWTDNQLRQKLVTSGYRRVAEWNQDKFNSKLNDIVQKILATT